MSRPKQTPWNEPVIYKRKKKRESEEELDQAYMDYGAARKKVRDHIDNLYPNSKEVWDE